MKDPYKSPDKIVYDSATGSTFKEAFAEARKEGKKTFEWNGKKYGTKLKGEDEPKQGKYKEDSTIKAGTAAGRESEGRTRARPEDYEQDEYKRGRFENKMNRSLGRTTDPENAAKIKKYNETRKKDAEERAATAERTQAGGVTDTATLRRSEMDASLPVDEMRIYSRDHSVKRMATGGMTASRRGDGIAQRGKTKGRMV
jgi:hypothetical protein